MKKSLIALAALAATGSAMATANTTPINIATKIEDHVDPKPVLSNTPFTGEAMVIEMFKSQKQGGATAQVAGGENYIGLQGDPLNKKAFSTGFLGAKFLGKYGEIGGVDSVGAVTKPECYETRSPYTHAHIKV